MKSLTYFSISLIWDSSSSINSIVILIWIQSALLLIPTELEARFLSSTARLLSYLPREELISKLESLVKLILEISLGD